MQGAGSAYGLSGGPQPCCQALDGYPVDLQAGSAGAVERAEGLESREHLGVRGGGGMVEDPDAGGTEAASKLVVLFALQGFAKVSPFPSVSQRDAL